MTRPVRKETPLGRKPKQPRLKGQVRRQVKWFSRRIARPREIEIGGRKISVVDWQALLENSKQIIGSKKATRRYVGSATYLVMAKYGITKPEDKAAIHRLVQGMANAVLKGADEEFAHYTVRLANKLLRLDFSRNDAEAFIRDVDQATKKIEHDAMLTIHKKLTVKV